MTTILDRIVAYKPAEVAAARAIVGEAELERRIAAMPPPRDFAAALRRPGVQVIAEVKRASPSAGAIRAGADPAAVARTYAAAGAACISVLTDGPSFGGSLDDLVAVRAAVEVPLLRKDFLIDRYQLLEARAAGADAVLLIAEVLPGGRLGEMLRQAEALGLQALVELYDEDNLPRVLEAGAKLVGINNRDLRSFEVRLERTEQLAPRVPAGVVLVSESGLHGRDDVARVARAGAKAVLVGEALMRAADAGAKLRELLGR